ncbi:RsfA family transcriptional regulator [Bacillus sp. NEB1478]|uniref:RsfA family transcriptional regulator n=1 Tax=Bacillus sp. NEB1478 TaxID=3073816 RepID=UPI002873DEAB|nr:RsfA family transcriptional regulator [Bacillus sp. NEB1478]WNB90502.1 RsfA family transcriptional regulator [Bacillus sp. NEB1478]
MTNLRQDAWTQEEDTILAQVTLKHIRDGSTQLVAFEEVGEKLSRTPAACGFRWNSLIRKQYESSISEAKQVRKDRNKRKGKQNTSYAEKTAVVNSRDIKQRSGKHPSIDDVIHFLQQLQLENPQAENLEVENKKLLLKLQEIKKENGHLKKKLDKVMKEFNTVSRDYKELLQIMDRARKLVEVPVNN